jgi:hypothetical protein
LGQFFVFCLWKCYCFSHHRLPCSGGRWFCVVAGALLFVCSGLLSVSFVFAEALLFVFCLQLLFLFCCMFFILEFHPSTTIFMMVLAVVVPTKQRVFWSRILRFCVV